MKKETSNKKSKLILIIVIAVVAALAIAGGVLAFVLGGSGESDKIESEIYYNVDREQMMDLKTGLSLRKTEADGMVYIRFLVGGEEVELPVQDRKLVNTIDTLEYVCLETDKNGVITNAVDATEVYVKIYDKVYVQNVQGENVTINTSMALNGMQKKLTVTDDMGVWHMSKRDLGEITGKAVDVELLDQIVVFGTDEETPYEVFITDRYERSKVYYRTSERMYDATNKVSTRKIAEDGYWYIDFTCEGVNKTYRTSMQEVINALDGYTPNAACCGLVFNEQGDIIDCFNAGIAAQGIIAANNFDITALSDDGKTFTATRVMFGTELGKSFTGTITDETQIFHVSSAADVLGEPTTLQMNDRVLVITRADGVVHTIFVVNRMVDGPLYYNLSRKWSSAQGWTREPDENGWYVFELAANGKVKTLRTKDAKVAEQLDAFNLAIFGLKLKGDVIVKAYDAVNVAGGFSFAGNNFVTSTAGGVLGTVSAAGVVTNGIMSADCQVFDVSSCYKNFRGEKTTVREGDQVMCYQNATGEVTHIWVLNRLVKGTTMYWNVNRYYDSEKKETSREKVGDYYVFNMIKVGTTKVVQLKTKDKNIATRIDREGSTTVAALKVSGGIIKAAYPAPAAIGGMYRLPGFWILGKHAELPDTWEAIASTGAIGNLSLAEDCGIYNFSPILNKAKGEKTTLKEGDRVWPIAGQDGKVKYIFVIDRDVPGSKLAVRKGGAVAADEKGVYTYQLLINGKVGTYTTTDEEVATFINKQNYGFSVKLSGTKIVSAQTAISAPEVRAFGSGFAYYDVVGVKNGVLTVKRNRPGQADTGKEVEVALDPSYKAYNIDPASGENYGKSVKLTKGDRVYAYAGTNNTAYKYFFIVYDNTLSGGNMRKCEHCGKTVHWESLFAGYSPAAGCAEDVVHMYVPADYTSGLIANLGSEVHEAEIKEGKSKPTEIVIDLNGKTLTRNPNNATGGLLQARYGNTVIITDYSKAQTGKMVSAAEHSGDNALLKVYEGAKLIIEKGVYDASKASTTFTTAAGGTVTAAGELVINGGTFKGWTSTGRGSVIGGWGNSSITINGGTFVGNKVTESSDPALKGWSGWGGVIATTGDLTITGGTIKGGTAVKGDNIYFSGAEKTLTISGGTIDGGIQVDKAKAVILSGKPTVSAGKNYGIKLPAGMKVDATGLKAGAKVYVNTSGVFTTDFASAKAAQNAIDKGMLKAGKGMMLKVQGKAIASVVDTETHDWTGTTSLPTMGKYRLTKDVTIDSVHVPEGDLWIDLNGHTITRKVAKTEETNQYAFRTGTYTLTIDDSTGTVGAVKAELEEGTVFASSAGLVEVSANGQFVLMDGILDGSNINSTYNPKANSGVITAANAAKDGATITSNVTIIGGKILGMKNEAGTGSAIAARNGCDVTIYGGEFVGNTALGGGVIAMGKDGKLTVEGGTFTAGTAIGGVIHSDGEVVVSGGTFNVPASTTGYPGAIYGEIHGTVTITGGEFNGRGGEFVTGKSGGLITAKGELLEITGGTFLNGNAGGYGSNIYYSRETDGKGEMIVGGNAVISGGITIRGKEGAVTKLTVEDGLTVNRKLNTPTGYWDFRMVHAEAYVNDATTAAVTAAGANTDFTLKVTCKKKIQEVLTASGSYWTEVHTIPDGEDLCVDCGFDKTEIHDWTDPLSLPTQYKWRLATDVTVSTRTLLNGDMYLDLNGHTVNMTGNNYAIGTNGKKLEIDDLSGKTGDELGTIKTTATAFNADASVIFVSAIANGTPGELILRNGIIDGSAVTNGHTTNSVNHATITVGNATGAFSSFTMYGGVVKGQKTDVTKVTATGAGGSAIALRNSTHFTMHGGTVQANQASGMICPAGGCIVAGPASGTNPTSSITIKGGTLVGGKAGAHGGAIYTAGNLTIEGGTISGGTANNNGKNICVNNANSVVNISGGTIDGGVDLANYSSATITGDTKINQGTTVGLWIRNNKKVNLQGLTGTVYVDMQTPGVFTTNFTNVAAAQALIDGENVKLGKTVDADAMAFAVDGTAIKLASAVEVTLSKTAVELTVGGEETLTVTKNPAATTVVWTSSNDAVATVVDGKITAVSAGTATITATGTYNDITVTATCTVTVKAVTLPLEQQDWQSWTDSTKLPTKGKYRLDVDEVNFTTVQTLTGELWLDLNGQTVTMTGTTYAINTKGQKLVIDDLSGKTGAELGTIKTTATSISADAAVIFVGAVANGTHGELVLNNGIIDGSAVTNTISNAYAGTITVGNATNSYSTFTMNGGIIKGQTATNATSGVGGSAIGMRNGVTFTMNGGQVYAKEVTSGSVSAAGTTISSGNGTITINGGELYGSRAVNHGGNIYTTGNLYIHGGLISGGYSYNSGVICSNGGAELEITGGVITGGTSSSNTRGKNIDKSGGTLTITGGVIAGGVSVRGNGTIELSGNPVISDMLQTQQKGDIWTEAATASIKIGGTAQTVTAGAKYSLVYANGAVSGLTAWAAATESATLPTKGNVKLTDNVTISEPVVLTGNLTIDLNGNTITNTGSSYAIRTEGFALVITDSSADKDGAIVSTAATMSAEASVIYVNKKSTMVLGAGVIDATGVSNSFDGVCGAVTVGSNSTLIVNDGEIKGHTSTATSSGKGGSAIGMQSASNLVVNGGIVRAKLVTSGVVSPAGTVVTAGNDSNIKIYGGTLYGSRATNHGGTIYTTGHLYIYGGTISGGYAYNGGSICSNGTGNLVMTGGTITGATNGTSGRGKGIDKLKGTATISGGNISGGISIQSNAVLELSGRPVIEGKLWVVSNGAGTVKVNGTAVTATAGTKYDPVYNVNGEITGTK